MPDCELLATCPFFNDRMKELPALAVLYKAQFCHEDYPRCARYLVRKALGKENVPADLYPPQRERAQRLLGET